MRDENHPIRIWVDMPDLRHFPPFFGQNVFWVCSLANSVQNQVKPQQHKKLEMTMANRSAPKQKKPLHPFFTKASEIEVEDEDEDDVPLSELVNGSPSKRQRTGGTHRVNETAETTATVPDVPENEAETTPQPAADHQSSPRRIHQATNILHQLHQRSKRCITITHPPDAAWSSCPWIGLCNNFSVSCMSFDDEGVLLAVGTANGGIFIYDFDMVVASDLKGRIDRNKDMIEPVMKLKTMSTPSHIRWGDADHLIVCFGSNRVMSIDVAKQIVNNSGAAVRAKGEILQLKSSSAGDGAISCCSRLSKGQLVFCFTSGAVILRSSILQSAKSVWTYNSAKQVSSVLQLSRNLLLLGNVDGEFTIIDWTKTTNKVFSSKNSPTIVASWTTRRLLEQTGNTIPESGGLGVRTMSLECSTSFHSQTIEQIGHVRVRWVTGGGFVLSMDLSQRNKIRVHHKPPDVKTLNSEREPIETATRRCSRPSVPVAATCMSNGVVAWQSVPQITHILPHHDKRVCQERQFLHSTETSVRHLDPQGRIAKLRMRSTSCIEIHPSSEWMIAASGSKLSVFNARRALPKSPSSATTC